MKKFAMIVSILLVAVLSVAMVGCSTYGSVKKAFEDAGYKQSETLEGFAKDLTSAAEKDDIAATVHGMVKGVKLVLIVEFKATDDMKTYYENSNTLQGIFKDLSESEDAKSFYESLEKTGCVKGNCLVVPVTASISDVKEVMKNA